MSGGVDSSVAALLMQRAGYHCTGVTMKLYDNEAIGEPLEGTCCSLADIDDARAVCARLGIPYYVFNFSDTFAAQVIDRFIAAYEHGATPNPCIDCNRYLKFDRLLQRARQTHFNRIATGHYARIEKPVDKTGRWLLRKGLDPAKDQSYVLYAMTQEQLAHTSFPLGTLTKQEVRTLAHEQGFETAHKHESQDICFVPNGDYGAFIRRYTGRTPPPGPLVAVDGTVLGTHHGVIDFTVGQRKGIGIAAAHPLYVKEIDPATNTVVVAQNANLYNTIVVINDINLIATPRIDGTLQAHAKHRYNQTAQPVTARQLDEDTLEVTFTRPQRALTKGQALVLYSDDTVIGGGTITHIR
jgi:tRNA-specific 2-thiouridylase